MCSGVPVSEWGWSETLLPAPSGGSKNQVTGITSKVRAARIVDLRSRAARGSPSALCAVRTPPVHTNEICTSSTLHHMCAVTPN